MSDMGAMEPTTVGPDTYDDPHEMVQEKPFKKL